MEITDEQRRRAEANRLAALAKRKALTESSNLQQPLNPPRSFALVKCSNPPQEPASNPNSSSETIRFRVRLEICSTDAFSITPVALRGFAFPGQDECFRRLSDCLSSVVQSHYTQNVVGRKACVYKVVDYVAVLKCLKSDKSVEIEEIPWGTLNVVERLSHCSESDRWLPCRPEHFPDEKVDELIGALPKLMLRALLPFQYDGIKFGLRRGGRCLIADEMGLGKTLQAIAIACCFINEGSVLVVCPAVLRFSWAEELERWVPFLLPSDIHLVFGHLNNPAHLKKCPRVVVISYTMLHRLRKSMLEREWALVIVDESHHVRCTKKASEPGETQTVLDMAAKVKRMVLLTGTPSLSRPYDIFHQINMLWPGLLGKNKFEFAKTYCDYKLTQGSEGRFYQDFSKGTRLEELNVLLKQTVMIRRLKEHVMLQLPPKRRQIIGLFLKRSEIVAAKAAVEQKINEGSDNENLASEELDESEDVEDCRTSGKLSEQELGIAKLSGFREWLSLHPLIAESDVTKNFDSNSSSQKMIIFAHHHKVLNGVQEFICEKGIGFVRIDGTTFARDRQSAVLSFRSSMETKIAIIGITAGGVGLDFSAAQNVVFLELPQSPSLMLQAEDRAHRRGQKNAVNIYIFCAKDTVDESHWRNLNKCLRRVSCTTNGKYDTIREIEVEDVSYLKAAPPKLRESCSNDIEHLEARDESLDENQITTGFEGNSNDLISSSDACKKEKVDDNGECFSNIDEENESLPQAEGDEIVQADECSFDVADSLRFEVSPYTGRIHLYTCISGQDTRPRPLFESFRPEELDLVNSRAPENGNEHRNQSNLEFIKDNPSCRNAVLGFVKEWSNLRPVEQKKLIGKPLQLPLAVELCFLEDANHKNGGLLKVGSKRRKTPLNEISLALPSNAVWKKVHLRSGYGKKEKEYFQGWTEQDEPLCKLCQAPCENSNAKAPEYFEDLFCNLACYEEYRMRTSSRYLRQVLFQLENGVCTNCQLDCHKLVTHIRPLSLTLRRDYVEKVAPKIARRKKMFEKLVDDPKEGNAWHADHIVPVYLGGGECKLENMRTLCVACHADVTKAQCADRRNARVKAKRQLKSLMNGLKDRRDNKTTSSGVKAGEKLKLDVLLDAYKFQGKGKCEKRERDVEDEVMVRVPGSAYMTGNTRTEGSATSVITSEEHV